MPLQVPAISSREGDEAQGKVNGRAPDGVGGRRFSAPGGNSPSISSDESDSQDGVSRLRRRETSTSRRVVGTCSARSNSTRSEGSFDFTPFLLQASAYKVAARFFAIDILQAQQESDVRKVLPHSLRRVADGLHLHRN